MTEEHKFAVAIPTYNSEAFIIKAINSVRTNKIYGKTIPIYIYDNHSTDRTVAVIESLKDERINISISEQNLGFNFNLKRCLTETPAEYIFILFSDDLFCENHILNFVNKREENENIEFYFSNHYNLYADTGKKVACEYKYKKLYPNSLFHFAASNSSWVVKKNIVKEVPEKAWEYRNIDWFLFIFFTKNFVTFHSKEYEVEFIQRNDSLGQNWFKNLEYPLQRMEFYDYCKDYFRINNFIWLRFLLQEFIKSIIMVADNKEQLAPSKLRKYHNPALNFIQKLYYFYSRCNFCKKLVNIFLKQYLFKIKLQ